MSDRVSKANGIVVPPESVRPRPIQKKIYADGRVRYLVKWRIGDRDPSHTCNTRREADNFRSRLVAAKTAGQMFDEGSGLPVSWLPARQASMTFLDLAIEVVDKNWKSYSSKHRMGRVEALAQLTVNATKRNGPDSQMLRLMLRNWGLQPDFRQTKLTPMSALTPDGWVVYSTEELRAGWDWLVKNSCQMREMDSVDAVKKLLERAAVSVVTGERLGAASRNKNRNAVGVLYELAAELTAVSADHAKLVRQKAMPARVVEPKRTPTPQQARVLVSGLRTISEQAVDQYHAFFTCMWCCGARPSELYGLRHVPGDFIIDPEDGWGELVLRNPLVGSARLWTNDRQKVEQRNAMKARASGSFRAVQLPPEAAQALLAHIRRTRPAVGELVFRNSEGNPLDQAHVSAVWRKCRTRMLNGRFTLTAYELRHTAASMMLRANVDKGTTAAELGNSVPVLERTYQRPVDASTKEFRRKLEDILNAEGDVA